MQTNLIVFCINITFALARLLRILAYEAFTQIERVGFLKFNNTGIT
jgi:hypothetical protein